ncbi:MAG: adenylosuccinate synthetase, partial [Actinomycetota bacterium]|nr:adenylosuccinate synthetase [Actinomycetota bacterium]
MAGIVIIGAQWGDEGKGKITDLLAENADLVIRFQGGNNAGHTIIREEETYKLHLMPSGILYAGKPCIIGNGVVIDPRVLTDELDELRRRGVDTSGLRISANAHMIMPYHLMLDQAGEAKLGRLEIGTTRRGIGPCYADKAARVGLRVCDLLEPDLCRSRLRAALAEKNALIERVHGERPLDLDAQLDRYVAIGERLRPFVADAGAEARAAHRAKKRILFEGAQGA